MIRLRRTLLSVFAFCLLGTLALAAEASPAGIWKWSVQAREGGRGFEQTVRLDYTDGRLTGVMPGRKAGRFSVPDTPISDASFKDGEIAFSVTRELNGQKFTTKYVGRLEGDVITGTFEREGLNRKAPPQSPWKARRQR